MIQGIGRQGLPAVQDRQQVKAASNNQNAESINEAKAAQSPEEVRAKRVSDIKEAIKNDTYQLDMDKTADKMASELLNI